MLLQKTKVAKNNMEEKIKQQFKQALTDKSIIAGIIIILIILVFVIMVVKF